MILRLFCTFFELVYGTLLPIYWSYKALETNSSADVKRWLTYWICFTLFTTLSKIFNLLTFFWIPFYYEGVILFTIFLACPYFSGSNIIYSAFVKPFLEKYECEIDKYIEIICTHAVQLCINVIAKVVGY